MKKRNIYIAGAIAVAFLAIGAFGMFFTVKNVPVIPQNLETIVFKNLWISLDKHYKYSDEAGSSNNAHISEYGLTVKKGIGLVIQNIYIGWIFNDDGNLKLRQFNADMKGNLSSTAISSIGKYNEASDLYNLSVGDFMNILDKINLSDLMKKVTTKCDYYNIELRGLQSTNWLVVERRAQGDVIGQVVDDATGKTTDILYKHQYIIFHDGKSQVLKTGESYTTKNSALDITITPMNKNSDGEYIGNPELEILYEITK